MEKKFVTAFTRKPKDICSSSVVQFTKPSMVKQSLGYAVDINNIYDNFVRTGKLPLNGSAPIYDENFINYDSLIEAQKCVDDASKYFAGLPAEIKSNYGNSLANFVKAVNNKDQFLIDKGLLKLKTAVDAGVELPLPTTPVKPSTDLNGQSDASDTKVNTVTTD